jgi:hypothetical protein
MKWGLPIVGYPDVASRVDVGIDEQLLATPFVAA